MQLKTIFPGANSSLLAMRQPELVLGFDMVRLRRTCFGLAGQGHVAIVGIAFVLTTVQTCAASNRGHL